MSTLRNTVQRRNHKERAQPLERQKWGLLEKPKDYKLRAADHKVKKRKIKALQQKASERNEDEFYFGMMSGKTENGVKVSKRGEDGGKVLSGEVVRLMKTQDVGYLRTVLQQTKSEKEKVRKLVISGDVGVKIEGSTAGGKKILFGEDGEEQILRPVQSGEDSDQWLSDDESGADVADGDGAGLTVEAKRKQHKRDVRRRRLQALEDREKDLSIALREVEDQRARMNGSIGGVNRNGTKFKVRQRKR